jgi:hypothetical protein
MEGELSGLGTNNPDCTTEQFTNWVCHMADNS